MHVRDDCVGLAVVGMTPVPTVHCEAWNVGALSFALGWLTVSGKVCKMWLCARLPLLPCESLAPCAKRIPPCWHIAFDTLGNKMGVFRPIAPCTRSALLEPPVPTRCSYFEPVCRLLPVFSFCSFLWRLWMSWAKVGISRGVFQFDHLSRSTKIRCLLPFPSPLVSFVCGYYHHYHRRYRCRCSLRRDPNRTRITKTSLHHLEPVRLLDGQFHHRYQPLSWARLCPQSNHSSSSFSVPAPPP
mmetsp:Transcript_2175/g.4408  ORF Transcript_2175/g.4408 Transcript_2175/m.4408 type:complete len:242 (+) Transcript_2175:279-1004(+)